MKRMLMWVKVVAVMTAMIVASAIPALATHWDEDEWPGHGSDCGELISEAAGPALGQAAKLAAGPAHGQAVSEECRDATT